MARAVLSHQARWPVRARKAGRGFLSSLPRRRAAFAAGILCAWVLTSCSEAHVSPLAAARPACTFGNSPSLSPERLIEARELAQRLKRGALYAALTQRYGPASGCSVEVAGPALRITGLFRGGVSVELGGQQAIEFSETRMVVRDVADADAVVLLKLAEQDAFGRDGCGIDWGRPEAQPREGPGSRQELVFRGPACQCQGRLGRGTDQVFVLILRATC